MVRYDFFDALAPPARGHFVIGVHPDDEEEDIMTLSKILVPARAGILGHALAGEGGEPVLVLHDWNGDHTTWDDALPHLDGRRHRFAFADLRGYGASRHLTGSHSIEETTADCLRLVDALGWRRFHVVGHSMTGMVVERVILEAGDRVASAVAVCPVSASGVPLADAVRDFFDSTTWDDEALRRLLRNVTPGMDEAWIEAKLRQNRTSVDPTCRRAYLDTYTRTDFADLLPDVETPLLIVVGENDPGLRAAEVGPKFLPRHRRAELVTMAGCGHYPMQEAPSRFVDVLQAFLAERSVAA